MKMHLLLIFYSVMILHSFFNPNLFPGQYGAVEKDALSVPH